MERQAPGPPVPGIHRADSREDQHREAIGWPRLDPPRLVALAHATGRVQEWKASAGDMIPDL